MEDCQQSVKDHPEELRRKRLGVCVLDKVGQRTASEFELQYSLRLLNEWNADAMYDCHLEARKAPNSRVKKEFLAWCYADIPELPLNSIISIHQKLPDKISNDSSTIEIVQESLFFKSPLSLVAIDTAVIDTSFLIDLERRGLLKELGQVFGTILITDNILDELKVKWSSLEKINRELGRTCYLLLNPLLSNVESKIRHMTQILQEFYFEWSKADKTHFGECEALIRLKWQGPVTFILKDYKFIRFISYLKKKMKKTDQRHEKEIFTKKGVSLDIQDLRFINRIRFKIIDFVILKMLNQVEQCLLNDDRENSRQLLILADSFFGKLAEYIKDTNFDNILSRLENLFGKYLDRYLETPYG